MRSSNVCTKSSGLLSPVVETCQQKTCPEKYTESICVETTMLAFNGTRIDAHA